ncbi:Disulfide-bond oxidoreductase YfcG [Roseivivax sp. THAF40]|uniref:glutathione S-transferase family protein n=1 Tax=unclassified Roseivivax TaxID=2639302 RepID=UPI0012687B3F|nr:MULTISPECIES: glutathione S-transferase family protein [unclassified Roseivivax]QFS82163.1 Disulfide-bond oxidoreductase YfcG [Roseivivax sp. THAF197b]QFT45963.1 Disulfide-bond oxidoreductase YfcG [Roseivivax sp. THAF40]
MIRLHHVPLGRSFRVMWLLEELGLEYEVVYYSIRDGSLRTPEFLALSPAGRVPALELDGAVLVESGAILQVLCERHPDKGLAPEPGTPERAQYLEMLHYSETVGSLVENLNLNRVFLRDPADASPVVIKLLTARLRAALAAIDRRMEHDHLLPSGFSAADIMFAYGFELARYYVHMEDFPTLMAYWDRLRARPGYSAAKARDGAQDLYDREFYPLPEAVK